VQLRGTPSGTSNTSPSGTHDYRDATEKDLDSRSDLLRRIGQADFRKQHRNTVFNHCSRPCKTSDARSGQILPSLCQVIRARLTLPDKFPVVNRGDDNRTCSTLARNKFEGDTAIIYSDVANTLIVPPSNLAPLSLITRMVSTPHSVPRARSFDARSVLGKNGIFPWFRMPMSPIARPSIVLYHVYDVSRTV